MPVEAPDLDAAAASYARTLREIAGSPPVLDLVHLGLGPDGHTASLFPGAATLDITDRFVVSAGDEQHPHPRLTFTLPAINRSPLVVFTVAGEEKREAFTRVRAGDESLPATRVRADQVIWLADAAALG
jgi:6-phosphogluconolactonase